MLNIDGAMGEGGGSIIRLALAFSLLEQKPIRIFNIRKNRPNPGLRAQHLAGVIALKNLSGSQVEGATVGSTELIFYPNDKWQRETTVKIATAGSIGLLIQQLQIAVAQANIEEIKVHVNGGATFGKWAPTIAYLQNVTFKLLQKMAYTIEIDVKKHGFYPKGGALATITLKPPKKLKPLKLETIPTTHEFFIESLASYHLKRKNVAERQLTAAKKLLNEAYPNSKIESSTYYVDALNPGSGIAIWTKSKSQSADTSVILGHDSIGERGISAEKVGEKAAKGLLADLTAHVTCDIFAADQLIPFFALAGNSNFIVREVTSHTRTNIELVKIFLEKEFKITELATNRFKISI